MTYFKKGFLPVLAVVLATVSLSLPAQAQVAPSGFEGSPARDSADGSVLGRDFRQVRTQDREQYRGGLTDLMVADRIEKEQEAAAEIQARQDAIQQQVQETLAQPTDYGVRLEALKRPPPSGPTPPPTQVVEPQPSPGIDPEPVGISPGPRSPRDPGGIAPAIQ